MLVQKKTLEYFLFLTFLNTIISTLNGDLNSKLLSTHEIIDDNYINDINLTEWGNETLFLYNKEESKKVYFSIFKYNDPEVYITSNINGHENESFSKNIIQFEYNILNSSENKPYINLNYTNSNLIEVISIVENEMYKYQNIDYKNGTNQNVEKNNFVVFLAKDEDKINDKINFNENLTKSYAYGIVLLSSNNINYIPIAFNFKEKIENKASEKDINIELKNSYI